MRYLNLSQSELKRIEAIYKKAMSPITRTRCLIIQFSHARYSVPQISKALKTSRYTIIRLFNAWELTEDFEYKMATLYIKKGRGAKLLLSHVEHLLPDLLVKHRSLKAILSILEKEHQTKVSITTLRYFIKKQMGYTWKRARKSLKHKQCPILFKKAKNELKELRRLNDDQYIDLYYGDASHFSLVPEIPYVWQKKGEDTLLPSTRGKSTSVFGLMNTNGKFYYQMHDTTINSDKMILLFDDFAKTLTKRTIVVLDNASVHTSKAFKAKIKEWEELDLHFYFIPPYSPELNLIEMVWRKVKYTWLEFDAYSSFFNLKNNLKEVFDGFGKKYSINFR